MFLSSLCQYDTNEIQSTGLGRGISLKGSIGVGGVGDLVKCQGQRKTQQETAGSGRRYLAGLQHFFAVVSDALVVARKWDGRRKNNGKDNDIPLGRVFVCGGIGSFGTPQIGWYQ